MTSDEFRNFSELLVARLSAWPTDLDGVVRRLALITAGDPSSLPIE